MKICIITQPLHTNYGGLLQAYALQRTLKKMGYDVVTARDGITRRRVGFKLPYFIFYTYKRYLRGDKRFNPYQFLFRSFGRKIESQREYIAQNTAQFIDNHIATIDLFTSPKRSAREIIADFDIAIVGSDQVWRREYADPPTYFLDFAQGLPLKRIAYAASFGLNSLEGYSSATKERCSYLAQLFDAISVREKSGVELITKELGAKAQTVADPTLLLDIADYRALATPSSKAQIVSYILDPTTQKSAAIEQIESHFAQTATSLLPPKKLEEAWHNIDECRFRGVDEWLGDISQAKFIITDSFHGVIFALLFHRDFIVIDNAERGSERFTSLLEHLALMNRCVKSSADITPELLSESIDYTTVDPKIEQWRNESREWLEKVLQ